MDRERFKKQIDFIMEIDKEKNIFRQNHITDYIRPENDAEHAWHMAVMIYLLREYSNEEFDVAKTMMMALIHDIVEIDAGDTYAYDAEDSEAVLTKQAREEAAAERIFGLLPENQGNELKSLFEEFEEGKTPEAKFARAMDSFQPFLLNNANGGKDWKRHGVKKSQVANRQARSKLVSEDIWQYIKNLIDVNTEKGNIIKD